MSAPASIPLSLALALGLSACGGASVVRVVDGQPRPGRFISDAAYALYARGADAEEHGDLAAAIGNYAQAAEEDPAGPEIWTRLGALHCRRAPPASPPPPEALAAFDRAVRADPTHGPAHRELARCLAHHGRAAEAVASADRALALDPADPEAALARAEVLDRAGRKQDAVLALRAVAARWPRSIAPWSALIEIGRRDDDAALVAEASAHVDALAPSRATASSPLLDAALLSGDLARARRAARAAGVSWSEVAVRAAALGRIALARAEAELLVAADPTDTSARIALAVAADLAGDPAAIAASLRLVPPRSTAPSPLARLLFAELLARRASLEAARAWLGPRGLEPTDAAADPLAAAAAARLRARLGDAAVTAR